jgi:murein DD-endopeptidase MepM/ murein hydrolase activator NlpD
MWHRPTNRGYVIWEGTEFLSPSYFAATGGNWHTGVDWNAATGGDTDLGEPVYAVQDSEIVGIHFGSVWGWVILEHIPSAKVWRQTAHHSQVRVKVGDKPRAGDVIALIGKGGPKANHGRGYMAHLHEEFRLYGPDKIPIDLWPSSIMGAKEAKAWIQKHYADPIKFYRKVLLPKLEATKGR